MSILLEKPQNQRIEISLPKELPPKQEFDKKYRRAPHRGALLTPEEQKLAINNSLRYIPI